MIWLAKRSPSANALGFTSSGSAIGLAGILFFTANAYRYGGGSFYVAYAVAMLVVGLPLLVVLYSAYADSSQRPDVRETRPFVVCAIWLMHVTSFLVLTLMTVVVAWAIPLFASATFAAPNAFDATAAFVALVRGPWPILALAGVWAIALLLRDRVQQLPAWTGRTSSFLLLCGLGALMLRGLSLPGGPDGLWQLFTPSADALRSATVWQGAIAQAFFTIALVFATFAVPRFVSGPRNEENGNPAHDFPSPSRLQKLRTDRAIAGSTRRFNRVIQLFSFETAAAAALFPFLFAFAIDPPGTSLASPLLALLHGTVALPGPSSMLGAVWLGLIVVTGLRSAMALMTFLRASLVQKLGMTSAHADATIVLPGLLLSCLFVLPLPIGPAHSTSPAGLALIDGVYRWVFDFGLPFAAMLICIAIGWGLGATRVRQLWNETANLRLGRSFETWVRWIAPAVLFSVIAWSTRDEVADRTAVWRMASNHAGQGSAATLLLQGAQIAIDREVVRKGDVVEITPPIGADSVYVTYRPGTELARTTSFATRGGPFLWEVQAAGLYLFETRDGTRRTVAVRYRHAPLPGLVILAGAIFACVIGGIASVLQRRRQKQKPYTPPVPNRIEEQHVGATV